MQRAVVLIGVKRTHDLPELQAAWEGTHKMAAWARSQGIAEEDTVVLTDEAGPLHLRAVKDAVKALVERRTVTQLLLYFSGHGINNARNEYWLLSEAIEDPDEAVNVTASEELARYCGIPHVVFFSDACRTAASGVQAQAITGGVVFPNRAGQGLEEQVDLFFGTTLGHPALEIQDPSAPEPSYQAAYTETLLEALEGRHPEILDPVQGEAFHCVRAWPLKGFLTREVPARVYRATRRNQVPDARITSSPDAWLARVTVEPTRGGPPAPAPAAPAPGSPLEETAFYATEDGPDAILEYIERSATATAGEAEVFERMSEAAQQPFGPTHFETNCGFKVRGARIERVYLRNGTAEVLDEDLVRVTLDGEAPENALIVFENGTGVVLPALFGFLAGLTFVDEDLVSVDYEPSEFSSRWPEFEAHRDELKHLRAVVAASSAMGAFHLRGDQDAERLARKMQFSKGYDPSLSLYAGYAYRDQGLRKRIERMADYQSADLGITLFDVAMLARTEHGTVLPFAPLLSQGWALLPAYGIELPPSVRPIARHVQSSSLWTLYDPAGVELAQKAMEAGDV